MVVYDELLGFGRLFEFCYLKLSKDFKKKLIKFHSFKTFDQWDLDGMNWA